jgi:signal transduction histidine kinase
MELKKEKWFYLLTILAAVSILLLGGWWLNLVLRLGAHLEKLSAAHDYSRLVNMLRWEGISFFVLVLTFVTLLLWLFLQDRKKNLAMHTFFASLTHELKTPLASMNMQSEFIAEIVDQISSVENEKKEQLNRLVTRLKQDGKKLEIQLDKALHLSRIQQNGTLSLKELDLSSFMKKQFHQNKDLNFIFNSTLENPIVVVDEHGLDTVFRNFFDNTRIHRLEKNRPINIDVHENNNSIIITYNDNGQKFMGDAKKLATLFYKHNSTKGTGIGLFLIKKLVNAMKGELEIKLNQGLMFEIKLPKLKD